MHVELVIAKLVTMVLGFLIAHQAYRGYRVHGSKPMFYVAVGFVFISVGAVIEGILFEVIDLEIFIAGTVQTTIVAIGMVIILYSLHGNMNDAKSGGDE
ncbi:hypothetical protein VB773_12415 [Haloarculaceae archaeon H-GB2-1]|nr:hypothetical protein [Haloarculaceae archaeon H-GB1-1]MEA5386806.1 hypothetical protein [Haloarculaceae archaeon H-GB11]MEA5408281.1 hypothetical protein [Haloarculaceae archaeon H-GB2-1]